jgi:deoxyribonuclease-4
MPEPSRAHCFGAHTVDAGGIHMAVRRAARGGMSALQVFSARPQFYNDRIGVKPERAARFREAMQEGGIEPRHALVHAAFVLNPASPEQEKAARSRAALARELERTTALGVLGCCFHPGSAGASAVEGAIERVAEAIAHALEAVPGEARVLVENTAGAGRTVGRTAAEVGAILSLVPAPLRARAGYGLDTCHLYASGHDLTQSAGVVRDILDRFQDAAGEPPAFFHLNDSEGALGSNRDRHALVGEGRIGAEPFRWLLADERTRGVPVVLETPQANPAPADDDDAPDPLDVRMLQLLASLAAG